MSWIVIALSVFAVIMFVATTYSKIQIAPPKKGCSACPNKAPVLADE
jgi:hypothetical protein